MERHASQQVAILWLLTQGSVTTSDFCRYLYTNAKGEVVGLAAEYRRTITDLRHQGYEIAYHKAPGGKGWSTLDAIPARLETTGQLSFIA